MRSEESDRVMRELRDELLSELESVQPDAHGFLDAVRPEELVEADHPTGTPAHDHESDHDHEKMHFEMFPPRAVREGGGRRPADARAQQVHLRRGRERPRRRAAPAERGGGARSTTSTGTHTTLDTPTAGRSRPRRGSPTPARKPAAGRKPKPKPR